MATEIANESTTVVEQAANASKHVEGLSLSDFGLIFAVLAGAIAVAVYLWKRKADPNRKKVIIRTNIIYLLTLAYSTVGLLFIVLVYKENPMSAKEAWNILEAPLMALIGGTLAISKDLLDVNGNGQ